MPVYKMNLSSANVFNIKRRSSLLTEKKEKMMNTKSSRIVTKCKGENIKGRLCWHKPKAMH